MFTSQAVADLAFMLTRVTSPDAADTAIKRALLATGLIAAPTIDDADLHRLLVELAAQGGPIEQIAAHVAMHGLDAPGTEIRL